jgi:transposase
MPIAIKLSPGQAHDASSAVDLFGTLKAGNIRLADRASASDALRQTLAEPGAWPDIRPMPRRKNIPAFSPFLYRYINLVERFFNKLKHYRAIATRYDKTPDHYLA